MPPEALHGLRFLSLLMTGQTSQVWQVIRETDRKYFALKLLLPETVRDPLHRRFLDQTGISPFGGSRTRLVQGLPPVEAFTQSRR